MSKTTYTPGEFSAAVHVCKTLDTACFPEEMWLGDDEVKGLILADAQVIFATLNNHVIGLAIWISEAEADLLLDGVDEDFVPHLDGAYCYSVAVNPEYHGSGLGKELLEHVCNQVKDHGFNVLSAHVRTVNGWAGRRKTYLQILQSYEVPDFWDDPTEVMEYQLAQL